MFRTGLKRVWHWYAKPATLAIDFYRVGHRWLAIRNRWVRLVADAAYRILHPVIEGWTGVTLPREARVGRNLRIAHRGKVVINGLAHIGDNCFIVHGVTMGNRTPGGPVPVIGNDVEIGAYAQLLGPITVGDGAKIGSLAVVVDDVPPGAIAVGGKAIMLTKGKNS